MLSRAPATAQRVLPRTEHTQSDLGPPQGSGIVLLTKERGHGGVSRFNELIKPPTGGSVGPYLLDRK